MDQGRNFKQYNPSMAVILNVKLPNVQITRVNKIGNKNWEVKTSKLIYIKGQI